MLRLKHRLIFPLFCFLVAVPSLFAQGMAMTREDQISLVAPSASGGTGLFNTVTADSLKRRDVSFGVYFQDFDLIAAPARQFAPLSARRYRDMGYDLYRLSASLGYGINDRWEVSASLPWDRLKNNGGDRVGFINGWLYRGRFSDSGVGDLRLATKLGLLPPGGSTRFALSAFTDLPTGEEKSGVASGNPNFGFGLHWTHGVASLAGTYVITGKRDLKNTNFAATDDVELPYEVHLDGGLNIPLRWWKTTNWISEANAVFYTGGDVKPRSPVFLVTGLRHWFGSSGWALNGGVRWNVKKFSYDNDDCRISELDDCSVGGLVGLTYAPMHLAAMAPPPPAPVPIPPPPPPPAPAPVPPPEQPVAPPRAPQTLTEQEIHFESGSARLTNIAKAILDDVALRMKNEPTSTAIVIGYTDDREATGPNADLDRRRAEAVRDYLVSRHGIDASRITVEGRDAREPVGDNKMAEGRLRNRRVVIRLIIP